MMNIHPTAIISEKAKIATSATIGPYCIIGADVEIGNDCSFLSHVVVKGPTIICLLYTSPSPRDRTRSRMPSSA